jgi:hypothetical protein
MGRKLARCEHGNGKTLCFECFRAGSERTRARQEAWAQRALPFETPAGAGLGGERARTLSQAEIAHRKRMLAYLESARRRA